MVSKYITPGEDSCFMCGEDNPHLLQCHHLVPRRYDGDDTPRNLVVLCANHHQAIEALYDDWFYSQLGIEPKPEDPDEDQRTLTGGTPAEQFVQRVDDEDRGTPDQDELSSLSTNDILDVFSQAESLPSVRQVLLDYYEGVNAAEKRIKELHQQKEREKAEDMKELVERIEDDYDDGAPKEVVIQSAKYTFNLETHGAKQALRKLRKKGEMYAPTENHYRTT